MSKTSEPAPESPVQVHLRHGDDGGVITFDLPLNEHIQRQLDRGELHRVHVDGTPYTGKAHRAKAPKVAAGDPHISLDDYQRIVAEAETEAREAEALAISLEERVKDGDESVTPAELENARQLKGFAKLRREAAARKAERAREAERQRQLAALRAEIEGASPMSRAKIAELLQTAETAVLAFVAACDERNVLVTAWRDRMIALKVPQLATPQPPADQQFLSWTGDVLLVGEYPPQRFSAVRPHHYVDQLRSHAGNGRPLQAETYESIRKEA